LQRQVAIGLKSGESSLVEAEMGERLCYDGQSIVEGLPGLTRANQRKSTLREGDN
jgi:hypothetical protein